MKRRGGKRPVPPSTARTLLEGGGAINWLIQHLQQTAVWLLAVMGFLFSLTTGYQLSVLTTRVVWTVIFFIGFFSVVFSIKHRGIALAACLLIAMIWAWRNADTLTQGALLLLEQLLDPLTLHMPDVFLLRLRPASADEAIALATVALQALLFIVTLLTGYFMAWRSSILGLAFTTLPLLIPLPFYLLSPSVVAFFCLVAAHLMTYVHNNSQYIPAAVTLTEKQLTLTCKQVRPPAQRVARQLLSLTALPAILFTALFACWLLPERDYARPEWIDALQERILAWDFGGHVATKGNDGLTHGDLRNLAPVRFSASTVLKVRPSEARPLYLRSFAGALFSPDGWDSVPDSTYSRYAERFLDLAPQNLHAAAVAASAAQTTSYTLSVQNVAASKSSVWMPNGLVTRAEEMGAARYVQDTAISSARASGIKEYTVEALPCQTTLSSVQPASLGEDAASIQAAYLAAAGRTMGLPDATGADAQRIQSAAQAYIDYVCNTYTSLPDETQEAAERLCAAYGLSLRGENEALTLHEICRDLYRLLTQRCAYAYSPPEIPADADFTTYFLEESQSGYCVHFATAAAVLLRSLDIPARYAEGYIVIRSDYEKPVDNAGYIEIEDTHAHAWVEVFDPAQLEWIPVEMTASANDGPASLDGDDENDDPDTMTPEPTLAPTPEPTVEPAQQTPPPDGENPSDSTGEPQDAEPSPTPAGASAPEALEAEGGASTTPEPENPSIDSDIFQDGGGPGGNAASRANPPLWLLLIPLCIAIAVSAALGWRRRLQKRRKREFLQADRNASVLAICRLVLSMLRFAGCEPMQPLQSPQAYALSASRKLPWLMHVQLQEVLELAQRVRFSNKTCTETERTVAATLSRTLSSELRVRLSRMRRLLFFWRYPVV